MAYTLKPFVINQTDIQFILDQLNFLPLFDESGNAIMNWDGTGTVYNSNKVAYADHGSVAANIAAYGTSYQSVTDLAGLRDVSGLNNNLSLVNAEWGAVDQIFTRSAAADYANYSPIMQAVADYAYAAAKQYYGKYSDGSATDGTPTGTFNAGGTGNTSYAVTLDTTAAVQPGDSHATDGTAINIPNVVDYTPRMISLATTTAGVTYDTWLNHAGDPAAANHTPNEIYYNANGVATVLDWGQLATVADGGLGQVDPQARLAASAGQNDHFIGALNPGVSPSNGFFVLFGQFFDHGLDFIDKSSGATIKIALATDDPLYGMKGPDGQPVHEITISRATVQTVDANGPEYLNHTSPFIDQSQTYGSHEQLTNLLREWVPDPTTASLTDFHAGMNLFDGTTLATAWTKADGTSTNDTLPTLDELRAHVEATGRDALTWEDVSNLRNRDASGHVIAAGQAGAGLSGSALLLDMNPRFDAGHLHGFYDTNGDGTQNVGEASYGNAAQSAKVDAAIATIDANVKTMFGGGSTFGIDPATHKLTLYMQNLPVGTPDGTPHTLSGASALYPFVNFADFSITAPAGAVHNAVGEILLASVGDHYVAGDGRVNENFGLTSIHHIFHEEHNYQVQNLIDALHRQDIVSGDPNHASLHDFQIDTGHMNAAGDFVYSDNSIAWDQDKVFNAAKLVVEMEYQHAAVDQYARNVTPNIQEFVGYSSSVNSAVSLEYSQAAFRFGHSTLRETIDTIDPTHGLTGKIMGYALKEAFLSPEKYADIGPAAIALGMTHQQMNEVDEFVTPALNQGLLGQPLDLAAINVARGRDVGIPTLNDFREAVGLAKYTSWNDFGQNMQHPTSLENFIAAYSFDGDMAKAHAIIGLVDGSIVEGDTAAEGFTVSQAYAFMNGGDTGFDHIDTWIGGLAEVHQPGGLLGETFDKVFVNQIESLMDGDRFYYLYRLAGQQFAEEVGNGQLKDIVERNTGLTHLNGNIFGYADQYVDLGAKKEVVATGAEALTTGNEHKYGDIAAVNDGTMGVYSNGGRGNRNDGHVVTIGGVQYVQDTRMEHGFDVNVTVANGGFEGTSLAPGAAGVFVNPAGNYSYNGPTGWTVTEANSTDAGLVSPTALLSNLAGHQGNAVFLQNGAMIAQATGKTIAAGDSYTLSLNVGDAIGVNFSGGFARLVAITVVAGVPISVVLAQEALGFPGEGQWQNVTLDTGPIAAAYAGFELKVEIQQTSGPSGGEILVDDIKVTGVVQLNDGVNLDGTPNTGAESNEIIVGTAGNDLIYAQGGDDTVYGDGGNDTLYGGYGIDRLYGGDGSDKMYGGDNPDLMDGGSGDDFLYGESSGSDINGNDQVIGGSGNDFISGGIGIDKLSGGTGDDRIFGDQDTDPFTHGSDGNDYVDGGSGGDILYGDNGDDVLVGGGDQDQMFGGNGDDIIRPGDTTGALTIGTDEVLGGDGVTDEGNKPGTLGFDLIDFSDNAVRPGGVTFNLADQQNPAVNVNGIPKQIAAFQTEGLIGSAGNDTLTGDSAGDVGLANATLDKGENWLVGGSGNDILTGAGGNDIIIGGSVRLDALIGKYLSGYTHNMNNTGDTAEKQLEDARYQGASHRVLWSETIDSSGLIDAVNTIIPGSANDFAKHFTELLRTETFKDIMLGDGGTDGLADTAVYSGNRADYAVQRVTGGGLIGYIIADLRVVDPATGLLPDGTLPDGRDVVVGVENFRFLDGTISAADLDKHGLAYFTPTDVPVGVTDNANAVRLTATSGIYDLDNVTAANPTGAVTTGITYSWTNDAGVQISASTALNPYVDGLNRLVLHTTSGTLVKEVASYIDAAGHPEVVTTEWNMVVGNGSGINANNTLNGTDSASIGDAIFGLAGNDTLNGLDGNDRLYGASGTDILNGGNGDDYLDGGSSDDTLNGGNGNDLLDGGTGADSMRGGAGNDTYMVDDASGTNRDQVDERVYAGGTATAVDAGGIDTVVTGSSYTLSSTVAGNDYRGNIENLTLTGSSSISGTGNELANVIIGNSGTNRLDGGLNAEINGAVPGDTLIGGNGNDTYVVNQTADVVIEGLNAGTDTVESAATFTLGANIENLTLTGAAAINGTGNSLNNVILGNTGTNTLMGLGGSDTYGVDSNLDVVDERLLDANGVTVAGSDAGGTDTVLSSVNYTLSPSDAANAAYRGAIENLTLTGAGNINGTGNDLDNVITGNAGNNTINAGGGTDTINYVMGGGSDTVDGGLGNDTLRITDVNSDSATLDVRFDGVRLTRFESNANNLSSVEAVTADLGNNTDTLSYAVSTAAVTVNLTTNVASGFTSIANIENVTGGSGNDTLTGNAASNVLDGGSAGNDVLIGGANNDTYVVSHAGVTITENASEGTDLVQSSISYTLGANVENLTLTGNAAINGTGNSANNVITGNSGNNTLTGGAGDDTLDGGSAGNDVLIGGANNDTYVVSHAGVTITENASEGTDLVQSSISYTLGANVENLTLTGNAAINGTGNSANNVITGNSGANLIDGGTGDDTLRGGQGNDIILAGAGNDTIVWNANAGNNNTPTDGRDFVDGGTTSLVLGRDTGSDSFVVNGRSNSAETFTIYSNTDDWDGVLPGTGSSAAHAGFTGLNANTEIVIARNGTIIAELDNIEEITVNTLITTDNNGNNTNAPDGGASGGDTVQVVGNFTATSLNYSTIHINGGGGDDTVDISGLTSDHRIVFHGAGGNNQVIGNLRPQDVVDNATPNQNDNNTQGEDDDDDDNEHQNRAPVVNGPIVLPSLGANTPLLIAAAVLLAGASDPDGDALTVTNLTPSSGSVTQGPDGWTFTPATDDTSQVSFSYDISDGHASVHQTASLDLTAAAAGEGDGAGAPVLVDNAHLGTDGDDVMVGGPDADVLGGGQGDDVILGNDSGDTLLGGAGDDLIKAGAGDDVVFGGAGNDNIFGGAGHDMIFGDGGNDRIFADEGNDVIEGGAGNDTVYGGTGDDRIIANVGDGDDVYWGEDGQDTLDYAAIGASLTIDLGNGLLHHGSVSSAQSGQDAIFGFENVIAGSGNDTIIASSAANVMDGGLGSDTFVFGSAADANGDTIVGLQPGDKIDLSMIDADTSAAGHQSFVLFVGAGFTSAGQVMVSYQTAADGEHTLVKGETNGDGTADFSIDVAGHHDLDGTSFKFA